MPPGSGRRHRARCHRRANAPYRRQRQRRPRMGGRRGLLFMAQEQYSGIISRGDAGQRLRWPLPSRHGGWRLCWCYSKPQAGWDGSVVRRLTVVAGAGWPSTSLPVSALPCVDGGPDHVPALDPDACARACPSVVAETTQRPRRKPIGVGRCRCATVRRTSRRDRSRRRTALAFRRSSDRAARMVPAARCTSSRSGRAAASRSRRPHPIPAAPAARCT
jgi:hypothetical protein